LYANGIAEAILEGRQATLQMGGEDEFVEIEEETTQKPSAIAAEVEETMVNEK
jgi:hypothetical protein